MISNVVGDDGCSTIAEALARWRRVRTYRGEDTSRSMADACFAVVRKNYTLLALCKDMVRALEEFSPNLQRKRGTQEEITGPVLSTANGGRWTDATGIATSWWLPRSSRPTSTGTERTVGATPLA